MGTSDSENQTYSLHIVLFLTHIPLDEMVAIFADNIFRCIFVNEKFCILPKISLEFVLEGPIDNKLALD